LIHELGLPENVLWVDRNRIQNADDFTAVIAEAIAKSDLFLAIVSNNYVQREWCAAEVASFAGRFEHMEKAARERRIFRIDKQEVDETTLPPPLRGLEAIRFYDKDPEKGVLEYYYRGKVAKKPAYLAAIRDLARSIYKRLEELGVRAPKPPRKELIHKIDRTVYVALPAADTADAYQTLVKELWTRGFTVVPNVNPPDEPPSGQLPHDGPAARAALREAMAQAEAAIHLVGDRRGFQPDGLDGGIVAIQLAEARAEAARRPGFRRLIWAPRIVTGLPEPMPERDPLAVLERFDAFIDSDEIESDVSAKFNEFVLQRLLPPPPAPAPAAGPARSAAPISVFIAYLPTDQAVGLMAAKRFKELGAGQVFFGAIGAAGSPEAAERQATLIARAEHVVFAWGATDALDIVEALDAPVFGRWRTARPEGRLCLFVGDPPNELKASAVELGCFGPADLVIDGQLDDLRGAVQPLLRAVS